MEAALISHSMALNGAETAPSQGVFAHSRRRSDGALKAGTTPGGKLVLWWDANDGRLVAQGDSVGPSDSDGAGRGGAPWYGSPNGPGSKSASGTRNGGDHN